MGELSVGEQSGHACTYLSGVVFGIGDIVHVEHEDEVPTVNIMYTQHIVYYMRQLYSHAICVRACALDASDLIWLYLWQSTYSGK